MARFEELQELWQRQPEVSPAQIADVTRSFRAYGRRQNWINTAKALIAGAILAACLFEARSSPVRMSGVLLISATAALIMARDWRNQRDIARADFSAPSVGFVNGAIDRLLAQRNLRRSFFWPLIAATVIGENLILSGTHRLWLRVAASVAPLAALELGLWVRRRRFDYECRPLLDQLRGIQAALEDRFE